MSMTVAAVVGATKMETASVRVKLGDGVFLDQIRNILTGFEGFSVKSVKFVVPSGGDYSGMSLDLSDMEFQVVLEKVSLKGNS